MRGSPLPVHEPDPILLNTFRTTNRARRGLRGGGLCIRARVSTRPHTSPLAGEGGSEGCLRDWETALPAITEARAGMAPCPRCPGRGPLRSFTRAPDCAACLFGAPVRVSVAPPETCPGGCPCAGIRPATVRRSEAPTAQFFKLRMQCLLFPVPRASSKMKRPRSREGARAHH